MNQTRKKTSQSDTPRTGRWRIYALTAAGGLVIVAGLFVAGRQHFSSMDFSIRNSRLRKQVDDLQSEKRRLLLAREVAQSPTEIIKAAKRVGLGQLSAVSGEIEKISGQIKAKADVAQELPKTKPTGIVKTAEVLAARQPAAKHEVSSEPKSARVAKTFKAE